ncbi:MAG: hypothetical protein FWF22_11100 [Treponema sp.]|nr:hypothetical protein [Treponema sp.]
MTEKYPKIFMIMLVLFSLPAYVPAAENIFAADDVNAEDIILPTDIYLIPQTVYVGDRGRLVISLGPAFDDAPAFVQTSTESYGRDLVINRMELEKRNNAARLLIDFVSFAPGDIVLPPIRIPVRGDSFLILGGIRFTVASILSGQPAILSDPALPLAVPGTGFLIYGGIGALLFLLVIVIAGLLWFRRFFGPLRKRFRQKKFLASIDQKIRLLRADDCKNDLVKQNEIFSLLAAEFREFLSFITDVNCSALTPNEFSLLPVEIPGTPGADYFPALFGRWDNLRFSGQPIGHSDVIGILDELGLYFTGLKKAEKGK